LATSACARHATLITTTDAKHVDAILLTLSRFINFLHQVLIFRGCTRISCNDIQLLLPASLISQATLRGILGLAFFLNAVKQLLSFAVFATLRIVRADYTHTTTPSCWRGFGGGGFGGFDSSATTSARANFLFPPIEAAPIALC
jgi:hypothetical protein